MRPPDDAYEEAARKAAEKAAKAAAAAAERAAEEARAKHNLRALGEAYARFLEDRSKRKSSGAVRSAFKCHVHAVAEIADKAAAAVTPEEITTLIRKVAEAGKERTAGILRSYLHAAYSTARKARLSPKLPQALADFGIRLNPVQGVEAIPVRPRARVLSPEELKAYIEQLGDTLSDQALMLALLAGGQRMAQLLRAKVNDFDEHSATLRPIGVLRSIDFCRSDR